MAFMIFCVRPGALLLLATAGLLGAAAGCSACCVPRPPTSLCMQAAAAAAAEPAAATTIEFFTHRWCPFAHRVWLSLEDKGLPHKLVEIDLYGGKPQWFLDLNPKGLVPVLRHEGRVICESNDICGYLDQLAAGSSGAGSGAAAGSADAAAVEEWVRWGGAELLPKGRKAILGGSARDTSALLAALQQLDQHLAAQPPDEAVSATGYKPNCPAAAAS
eukprot:COSAG06_NODE_8248_length_2226_cov_11053.947269_3_plen_217_part_00